MNKPKSAPACEAAIPLQKETKDMLVNPIKV